MAETNAFTPITGGAFLKDIFSSKQNYEHNEALADWERNEHSAQTARNFSHDEAQIARDWEKMMSDTSMQRALADYTAAGFSPLAALQGGGASSPVAPAVQVSSGSGSKASGSGTGGEVIVRAISSAINAAIGSAGRVAAAFIKLHK